MPLVRLTYASRVKKEIKQEDIEKIVTQSQNNNTENGITGYLLYNDKYFLQSIEGGAEDVNELYNTIVNDERHKHVQLLGYEEIIARHFTKWSLGYHTSSEVNDEILLKYSKNKKFKPFDLHEKSCVKLLKEISEV